VQPSTKATSAKKKEPMKAKITINWQTYEQICDSFIHIPGNYKELI
jgi:hypothetical protein